MWNSKAPIHEPQFTWDEQKALANERKHGISFRLAATVFRDPLIELIRSDDHDDREDRWVAVGATEAEVLLMVIHTYPEVGGEECVRIISARKATFKERREFESGEYSVRESDMTSAYDEPYEKAEGEWEFDFSKAVRGKFRYWRFQIFIDNEVLWHFHTQAQKTGVSATEGINEVLRRHVGLPVDSPGPTERR